MNAKTKRITEVVAALIWERDKFMICQRPAHKARGLLWEFVGGKVEPGETKESALIRECREELGIELSVGTVFMDVLHEYPDLTVHLTLFHATIAAGTPQKLEHNDIQWITASQIPDFPFCPADLQILERITEQYSCQGYKYGVSMLNFEELTAKVKALQSGEATGHDWFHTQRVLAVSRRIATQENCDMEIVQTAALLHDVADHKFGYTPESRGELLHQLMTEAALPAELQEAVIEVVESISFSEGVPCRESLRKESDVVKDADRLDALGAIGIARTFAYGGKMDRPIYDPADPMCSLQHFDDKLLRLAADMRTETGKALAAERHEFLLQFKAQFLHEWNL